MRAFAGFALWLSAVSVEGLGTSCGEGDKGAAGASIVAMLASSVALILNAPAQGSGVWTYACARGPRAASRPAREGVRSAVAKSWLLCCSERFRYCVGRFSRVVVLPSLVVGSFEDRVMLCRRSSLCHAKSRRVVEFGGSPFAVARARGPLSATIRGFAPRLEVATLDIHMFVSIYRNAAIIVSE